MVLNCDIAYLHEIILKHSNSLLKSWTLELAEETLRDRGKISDDSPFYWWRVSWKMGQEAGDRWQVETPVLDATLKVREESKTKGPLQAGAFANRVIAGMRYYMGSHKYQTLSNL